MTEPRFIYFVYLMSHVEVYPNINYSKRIYIKLYVHLYYEKVTNCRLVVTTGNEALIKASVL